MKLEKFMKYYIIGVFVFASTVYLVTEFFEFNDIDRTLTTCIQKYIECDQKGLP